MNPTDKNQLATVALVFELTPSPSGVTEAHLLPSGYFRSEDGRPKCCAAWYIDATIAEQVIARMTARKNDTLIDYEHQSLHAEENGQPVIAAAWFKTMEFRESGLYATNVAWTDKAKAHIAAKEYRYISAVFSYYEGTGEVLDIISATLTNTPALDGLDELAALSFRRKPTTDKGQSMTAEKIVALTTELDTAKTQVAYLTAERDGLKTQVVTLTQEKTALATQVATLEQKIAEAAASNEKQQCADLIQAALTSGKVLPGMKAYLEKKTSVADLKEAIDAFGGSGLAQALLTKQHTKDSESGNHGLTEVELAACKRMNVTPEDYKKAMGGE